MRVLINGVPLLTARSGVGNYVHYLSETLQRIAGEHEWRVHYLSFQSPKAEGAQQAALTNARRRVRNIPGMYSLYRNTLELLFRLKTWRKPIDLYHETNYAPFPFRGPTVVTVYDLSFFHHPETHPRERVRFYEKYFYPRLGSVAHFIAISESVKREMVRDLNIAPGRITVTPLGLDPQFLPAAPGCVQAAAKKYGLTPGGYILSVGTIEPRKNLKRLIAAYAMLPERLRERFPLALVGGSGWLLDGWLKKFKKTDMARHVRVLGYVPQEDMTALYSGAALLAYPSLYEGFGLPPLEAMGCGCPVLTSNLTSLPEVVGDAAVTVTPTDIAEIAEGLKRMLEDSALRADLSARGLARAKGFRWEDCARLTLGAYEKVLGLAPAPLILPEAIVSHAP